jgi:hypothetical protein
MTRKRPPLAALALIGVSALISACGSTASGGTGRAAAVGSLLAAHVHAENSGGVHIS